MDDGAGVRQSGRLDDHVVEALQLAEEFFETLDEIATDATAQTAVVQFENLLIDADHELVVDADGTEFVDDDGALVAVLLGKQNKPSQNNGSTGRRSDGKLRRNFQNPRLICL